MVANEEEVEGTHKRKLSQTDLPVPAVEKPRKKPIACRPCHARKIKCSFEQPCSNCQQSKYPQDCVYPTRDHKVTVTQSYIDKLVEENRLLRQGRQFSNDNSTTADNGIEPSRSNSQPVLETSDGDARNPLLDERSWFHPLGNTELPIHIGEAADAAFATRFRQALANNPTDVQHIPRKHYVSDAKLMHLSDNPVPWPPLAQARLLIKAALDTVGTCYHCVRRSEVYSGLKQRYRNLQGPRTIFDYKLWALFALGEAYSSRTQSTSEDTFPGLLYFARASRMFRGARERPQIDIIEVLLLLSLYSLLLNRRHGAYYLAGSAVHSAVIVGLHQNIPEAQLPDRAAREHRVRIFWTAYALERLWASKMGHPVSIQDDDIGVDLPSNSGLSETELTDFLDDEYMNAFVRLSRLSKHIISSIYSRKATNIAFSQRVQTALKDLRGWVEGLPKHLQIPPGAQLLKRPTKWLHLSFNQYVILATRPVLLHILRAHRDFWLDPDRDKNIKDVIGETPLALAEACIRCARHSHRLLTDTWIDGSFAIFDYTYTQYLFSAATILAISSLSIGAKDDSDRDSFDSACQFLEQLSRNGNFAANEFGIHLNAIKLSMAAVRGTEPDPTALDGMLDTLNPDQVFPRHDFTSPGTMNSIGSQPAMTAEMALAEPSLQDFLSQPEFDGSFLDNQIQGDQMQALYYPSFQDDSWMFV